MRKHQQNDYSRTANYLNEAHLGNVLHHVSYILHKYETDKQFKLNLLYCPSLHLFQ